MKPQSLLSTLMLASFSAELLADNKLNDYFAASPAIANGRIYLRGWGAKPHLYAIETR